MAITKLLRIKENKSGGHKGIGLKRCLIYICDPTKTENGYLISGNAGSNPEFIFDEMIANKKLWSKEEGSQGFHYVLSFRPDDPVTPELALHIGEEFCDKLLDGHYIWVVTSHTDTEHCHVHICFDSVSWDSGYKFHSGKHDWIARIQPITDELCLKHGLSTLSYDPEQERTYMYHKEWEEYSNRDQIHETVTWTELIRDDVDQCIGEAVDWNDFIRRLEAVGYTVRGGKYLSLQSEGRMSAMRTVRLGPGYSKEELLQRVQMKDSVHVKREGRTYKAYGDPRAVYRSSLPFIQSKRGYSPLQKMFIRKTMRLRHYRRPENKSAWRYRKDVVSLGKLTAITCYLFENGITSVEEIQKRLSKVNKQRGTEASAERKLLNDILEEYEKMKKSTDIIYADGMSDVALPSRQDVFQIRINRILYGDGTDLKQETFTARIPSSEEYVRLCSADSRIFNHGETISTYIYSDADYQLETIDGSIVGQITGDRLKERFKSREIKRNINNDKQQEKQQWKSPRLKSLKC